MKILTFVGTRPEIIRLSRIIEKLDKYFNHILVHTGQNWDVNLKDIFFNEMRIRKPDINLNIVGNNLGETIGNVISQSYNILSEQKPDAILILGDTNSALSAISAKRLKIPIFHMEAGNRCFNQLVPEEINRKIVDHISDINIPYTENSRRNLLNEGIKPEYIIVSGSPLKEIYDYYENDINNSNILTELNIKKNEYILMSVHREENLDINENWNNVIKTINEIAKKYNYFKIIMTTHPRTNNKIKQENIIFENNIIFHHPFSMFDYVKLQKNAFCVISDSGTINEESALLQIPAISFRICTERPEIMDAGCIIMSGLNQENVLKSIEIITSEKRSFKIPNDYLVNNVSDKIVNTILSYVPFVNKNIWNK